MGFLLVAAGGVFALLFVINLIIQTIRNVPKIGFSHLLLAFLVTLIPIIGLIQNQMGDAPLRLISVAAVVIGIVVIVPSLIVVVIELRRPQRLEGSRGILGLGVGLLVIVSVFSVPLIAQSQFAALDVTPTPISILAATSPQETTEVETDEPTSTVSPTPSPTITPSSTATQRPQPTATATRFRFSTRTPVPTATLPNPCIALTLYNINLRSEPDTESELLTTIPYNLSVTVFGRNRDSTWWYVRYEDQTGWLDGQYLTLSASCENLPERAP